MPYDKKHERDPRVEKCIKVFTEREYAASNQINLEMVEYESDIDCHYIMEAYKCICDYFLKLQKDPYTRTRIDFIFHVMARELNDGVLQEASKKYPNEEAYSVSERINKDKF